MHTGGWIVLYILTLAALAWSAVLYSQTHTFTPCASAMAAVKSTAVPSLADVLAAGGGDNYGIENMGSIQLMSSKANDTSFVTLDAIPAGVTITPSSTPNVSGMFVTQALTTPPPPPIDLVLAKGNDAGGKPITNLRDLASSAVYTKGGLQMGAMSLENVNNGILRVHDGNNFGDWYPNAANGPSIGGCAFSRNTAGWITNNGDITTGLEGDQTTNCG